MEDEEGPSMMLCSLGGCQSLGASTAIDRRSVGATSEDEEEESDEESDEEEEKEEEKEASALGNRGRPGGG